MALAEHSTCFRRWKRQKSRQYCTPSKYWLKTNGESQLSRHGKSKTYPLYTWANRMSWLNIYEKKITHIIICKVPKQKKKEFQKKSSDGKG